MTFLPQAFLSNINSKDGLAKPSRFQVLLPIPQYINSFIEQSLIEQLINLPGNLISDVTSYLRGRNEADIQSNSTNTSVTRYLSLQCEATELPGRSMQTADVKIYGPIFKVPYQTQYQDINLTFICTNEFFERKLFDRWLEAIMPNDTNNLRFAKGKETRYLTNVKIIQYDDFVRQIYAVELIDAYPIGIASQQLSWGEENFHRLTVQFTFQKYKTIYSGNYNLTEFVLEVFGAQASRWIDSTTGKLVSPVGKLFNKYF
jgi:hypothetical protein